MSDDFRQSGGSPWGTPPGGGGGNGSGRGPTPPDIEKIIREFQEKIKKFLPGGSSSGGKQALLVMIILGFISGHIRADNYNTRKYKKRHYEFSFVNGI